MREVEARVDRRRDGLGATAGDPVRLRGEDLAHVPLERRERVGIGGRAFTPLRLLPVVARRVDRVDLVDELRRGRSRV